ncbi:MAG TPA: Xaa-Pro peptidase family protein [Chloroflexia bacterium]|nr:Xaa-Pro peptidase family protein [Chloroflexia bacterium]
MNGKSSTAASGRPSASAVAGRRQRLRAALVDQGLDLLLVSQPANERYLSGFTGDNGMLLVTADTFLLVTDSRYTIQAAEETVDTPVVQCDPRMMQSVAEQIRALSVKRLGFEADHLVYSQYEDLRAALPEVELVPTRGIVNAQRAVKDAGELALLRRAVAISDQAFAEVSTEIRPGMTEREVARRIEARMVDLGAEAPAFPTIVATGRHGAMAHATPDDRVIGEGEPLVIDMGARYAGYNSDMTRTLILGPPTAQFKEIYNLVLRANLTAEAAARAGLSGQAIDAAARDVIKAAGHGDHFGHGTGHGIGIEVHEAPRLSVSAGDQPIAADVPITIEPGVYLEEWGGVRIEDIVLVGPAGAEVLTQAPKHPYYD